MGTNVQNQGRCTLYLFLTFQFKFHFLLGVASWINLVHIHEWKRVNSSIQSFAQPWFIYTLNLLYESHACCYHLHSRMWPCSVSLHIFDCLSWQSVNENCWFNWCLNSSDSFDEFLTEASSVIYISLVFPPTVGCGAPWEYGSVAKWRKLNH